MSRYPIKTWLAISATVLSVTVADAQSVEAYAGNHRAGIDLMWLRTVKRKDDRPTPLLYFSRNRAGVAYKGSPTLFASTNAVSCNFKGGIGLVAVGSFLNAGFTPKAGLQYHRQSKDFLFFGWMVADLSRKGAIDVFGMFRYTPPIATGWKGFTQLELFPVLQTASKARTYTQRLRLGVKRTSWSTGLMHDLSVYRSNTSSNSWNLGVFFRQDF